jgi:hypothetical protein
MRFDLDVPDPHGRVQPYSLVSFFWRDIPEKYRSEGAETPRQKPRSLN